MSELLGKRKYRAAAIRGMKKELEKNGGTSAYLTFSFLSFFLRRKKKKKKRMAKKNKNTKFSHRSNYYRHRYFFSSSYSSPTDKKKNNNRYLLINFYFVSFRLVIKLED